MSGGGGGVATREAAKVCCAKIKSILLLIGLGEERRRWMAFAKNTIHCE